MQDSVDKNGICGGGYLRVIQIYIVIRWRFRVIAQYKIGLPTVPNPKINTSAG
jgi:hypothetical protein